MSNTIHNKNELYKMYFINKIREKSTIFIILDYYTSYHKFDNQKISKVSLI